VNILLKYQLEKLSCWA